MFILLVAGEEWRKLTSIDKMPYERRAELEKQKYGDAMKDYNMVWQFYLKCLTNWINKSHKLSRVQTISHDFFISCCKMVTYSKRNYWNY